MNPRSFVAATALVFGASLAHAAPADVPSASAGRAPGAPASGSAAPVAGPAASASASASPAQCTEGISEKTTKALFARLGGLHEADGCRLDALDTEQYRMRLRFAKAETALPEALVVGNGCARGAEVRGKAFAYLAPPELAAACPATLQALRTALEGDDFGGTLAPTTNGKPGGSRYPWIAALALVAVVLAAYAYARSRRASPGGAA